MDDKNVIDNIGQYIKDNDISLSKLSKATGIAYHSLWTILNQNDTIKLGDYIKICNAFDEPFDFFICKNEMEVKT